MENNIVLNEITCLKAEIFDLIFLMEQAQMQYTKIEKVKNEKLVALQALQNPPTNDRENVETPVQLGYNLGINSPDIQIKDQDGVCNGAL